MWSQQADPPSPGGLCMEGSCSRLHFVERTFRNLCSRSFPPHCKTGRNPNSQVFHCRSETFSAKSPKTCLSTRARRQGADQGSGSDKVTNGWAGPAKPSPPGRHLDRPVDMGLLCAHLGADTVYVFDVFQLFCNFFIQKQCNMAFSVTLEAP